MGTSAWAGDNDLLWDYSETAPASNPDNGLYYASKVNDAAGTKNGLKGIKMNSSGYCFFAKAAVEGTLKLNIGPRDGSKAFGVDVYACTDIDATAGTCTKGELIATTATSTEPASTVSVDISANVTGIYIARSANSPEGVVSKIQFTEKVARTFTDFKVNFMTDPYTVVTPESGLPTGVTVDAGSFHDSSHGYTGVKMTVPVDGTVKFTIGGCQYSAANGITVTDQDGNSLATVDNKTTKCYHQDGSSVTYIYVGSANTLTFTATGNTYIPYFTAEATEVQPAVITYKDQDGNVLGTKDCYEGDALGEIPYTEADLTIPDGSKFRGWVYSTKVKVNAKDVITGNTTISALVTPIESVSVGSIQTYDLTQKTFYPEDHETMSVTGGSYHDTTHGWTFGNGNAISVDVAGKAEVILTECKYSNEGDITVTDAAGSTIATVPAKVDEDGSTAIVKYDGEATTLTFTFAGTTYIHKVQVYNVQDFLEKDETTGYYIVPAGDAAAMVLAFNEANATPNTKIYLPAATYDLGETTGVTLSGSNTTVVGEGVAKTIIRNCPPVSKEGLGTADLLLNTGTGLYMQDLTLKNDLDYYSAGSAGRAAVLHDKGTKTIIKNVNFRSYQDTYYSNKLGAYFYFETDTLQGTVDYLCGDGRVYYNKCTLFNAKRSSGDTMTANSELYVFNNCDVVCEDENTPYNFGRAWSDDNNGAGPTCVYLNTTLKDNGSKLISDRWNTSGINCDYGVAGEYNTMNAAGENITPTENSITFKKKSTTLNTILDKSAEETYSITNVLGDWAQTAQEEATQVELTNENLYQYSSYLVSIDGQVSIVDAAGLKNVVNAATNAKSAAPHKATAASQLTVRAANTRGGFGPAFTPSTATAISAVATDNQNANAPIYNVAGQRVNAAAKGVLIQNGHKFVK